MTEKLIPCPNGGRCGSVRHYANSTALKACHQANERQRPRRPATMTILVPGGTPDSAPDSNQRLRWAEQTGWTANEDGLKLRLKGCRVDCRSEDGSYTYIITGDLDASADGGKYGLKDSGPVEVRVTFDDESADYYETAVVTYPSEVAPGQHTLSENLQDWCMERIEARCKQIHTRHMTTNRS